MIVDYKELIRQIQELLASYEKVRYGEYVGAPWPYNHDGPFIYTEPEAILLDLSIQAINDLQEKLESQNRWIPCSERMPEEGLPEGRVQVTVVACTDAGKEIIASRVFRPEKKFIYGGIEEVHPAHWSWSEEMYSEITRWMPLPETQKEE